MFTVKKQFFVLLTSTVQRLSCSVQALLAIGRVRAVLPKVIVKLTSTPVSIRIRKSFQGKSFCPNVCSYLPFIWHGLQWTKKICLVTTAWNSPMVDCASLFFSDKSIEPNAFCISNANYFFKDAVSSSTFAGFVNKRCCVFRYDGIIHIEPLAHGTLILLRPLSRYQIGLAAKTALFLFVREESSVSGRGLLHSTWTCSSSITRVLVGGSGLMSDSVDATE